MTFNCANAQEAASLFTVGCFFLLTAVIVAVAAITDWMAAKGPRPMLLENTRLTSENKALKGQLTYARRQADPIQHKHSRYVAGLQAKLHEHKQSYAGVQRLLADVSKERDQAKATLARSAVYFAYTGGMMHFVMGGVFFDVKDNEEGDLYDAVHPEDKKR